MVRVAAGCAPTWRRGVVVAWLTVSWLAGVPSPAHAACPDLTYFGGPVISNVEAVQVTWNTPSYQVSASIDGFLPTWFPLLMESSYLDLLGEYGTLDLTGGTGQLIGRGTFTGRSVITPAASRQGTSITEVEIGAELVAQIEAGNLPAPTFDALGYANTLYFVEIPAQITVVMSSAGGAQSCVQFCSFHWAVQYQGKSLRFAVMPDVTAGGCAAGCGSGAPLDNVAANHTHQLAEAVTDPDVAYVTSSVGPPMGWYSNSSSCGEIGDVCNAQQAQLVVSGHQVTVQKLWSNRAQACVATLGTPLPVCDGTTGACRPCTAADDGAACSGAKPHCETDAKNVKFGECVACTSAAHCAGSTGACGRSAVAAADDVCRACEASSECPAAAPVCVTTGPEAGACVAQQDAGVGSLEDGGGAHDGGTQEDAPSADAGGARSGSKGGCAAGSASGAGGLSLLALAALLCLRRRGQPG